MHAVTSSADRDRRSVMSTTTERGLLQAILEAPPDDVPRLIYADWLDENGQPDRAEFIRAQIERASLPPGHPRGRALLRREEELLQRHGTTWASAVAPLVRRWRFH